MAAIDRPSGHTSAPLETSKLQQIADGAQFIKLKKNFLRSGKGRPSSLPSVEFNNLLLIQLFLLKEQTVTKTWEDVGSFLAKLFPAYCFPSIQSIVETTVRDFKKKCEAGSDTELFLKETKDSHIFPGKFCLNFGISRADLKKGTLTKLDVSTDCPVGFLLEIFNCSLTLNLKPSVIWERLHCLVPDLPPDIHLKQKLCKIKEHNTRLRKDRGKEGGATALGAYLNCPWHFEETIRCQKKISKRQVTKKKLLPAAESSNITAQRNSEISKELRLLSEQISLLKARLNEKNNDLATRDAELCGLKETIACQKLEKKRLSEENGQLQQSQQSLQVLRHRGENLFQSLQEKRRECTHLRRSNVYTRCLRLQRKLHSQELELKRHKLCGKVLMEEQKKKRMFQVYAAQKAKRQKKLTERLEAAERAIETLQDPASQQEVPSVPATRTAKGHFTEPVVMCVMELMGECEVPASRCSSVIQTVARHIFSTDLTDNMLPSKTSSLRFADQTHAVAKLHVAEELATKKFDVHTDGTTRNNKKYVGFQVTLEDKRALALGFDHVSSETAQTLLDLVLSKLQEFSLLYSPVDSEKHFSVMLTNIVGVMTDRAGKMKLFGKQLEEKREAVSEGPDKHTKLEFLHCNAHFLLGLSTAADKSLKEVADDKDLKGKLGRETLPAFKFYRCNESAACRFVRMACDTLGPRGDEQCGCHHLWLMFCNNLVEKRSAITSFRGNRFNNLFSSAAGLIYHREDILQFFTRRPPSNLKQKSVHADAQCDKLNTMLLALAVMYVYITGPFWNLVNSKTHYLDQHLFIQPIHNCLQKLAAQPDLLIDNVPEAIAAKRLNDVVADSVIQAAADSTLAQRPLLLAVFGVMAEQFVQVLERQLADFLPGGKYGSPPTEEARQRMQHCQLTNLLGEACFADLDYTMFKNRGATLHHHSTANMAKRNKPVSSWLYSKPVEERTKLMERSKTLGPQMRQADRQQQLLVFSQLQENLEMEEEQNKAKEDRKLQMKRKVADDVSDQGGPCRSQHDVDELLDKFTSKTDKMNALKTQIRYLRVLFEAKDDRLQLSNITLDKMRTNLSSYLEQRSAVPTSEPEMEELLENVPPIDSSFEDSEEIGEYTDPPFSFSAQGQTVAVFYNEGMFVGQVLKIEDAGCADITFMQQRANSNIFKWGADSYAKVKSQFVFYSGFHLIEKHRVWAVAENDWETLLRKWKQYVYTFDPKD